MCRIGDIILIEKFKNEYGEDVGRHPFIVVDTENDQIESMPLDMVAVLMSSFKSEKHRNKMLHYDVNIEVKKESGLKKDSFVKGNYLYCFQRNNINFFKVGSVDVDVFLKIREEIQYFLENGKATVITTNLTEEKEKDLIRLEK